jgi:hypothetical protein
MPGPWMTPVPNVYGYQAYPTFRPPVQLGSPPPATQPPATFPMPGPSSPYLRHASPMPAFVPQGFTLPTSPQMPEGILAPDTYASPFAPYDQSAYANYPFVSPISPLPQSQYGTAPYTRDLSGASPMIPPLGSTPGESTDPSGNYPQTGGGIPQGEKMLGFDVLDTLTLRVPSKAMGYANKKRR